MADAGAITWFRVCFFCKSGLDEAAGVMKGFGFEDCVDGRIAFDLSAGRVEDGSGTGDSLATDLVRDAGGGIGDCLTFD